MNAVSPQGAKKSALSPYAGAEFLDELQDGRENWIYGKRVEDVTRHPRLPQSPPPEAGAPFSALLAKPKYLLLAGACLVAVAVPAAAARFQSERHDFEAQLVADQLTRPWGMAFLPGGGEC